MQCVLCAESAADADKAYLAGLYEQISWKDAVADLEETNLKVDIRRVQQIAKNNKDLQWDALVVLCAVKEPSQLEFLVSILASPENRAFYSGPSGIAHYLAAQVRSEDDIEKMKSLLNNESLLPPLLLAIRKTTNAELVKKALNPTFADNTSSALDVTDFITYRLENKLPIQAKPELEAFLRRSCSRKGWSDSGSWHSARIASTLRYAWVCEWMINAMCDLQKRPPRPDDAARWNFINETIVLLAEVSGQDFGRTHIPPENAKADEQTKKDVAAAVEKCLDWWKTASADPKYRLNPNSIAKPESEQKK
jgi:hypothetical protein